MRTDPDATGAAQAADVAVVAGVAVVGVGAVGGVCAAHLCELRDDVVLCVRRPFAELRVDAPGRVLRVRPRIVTRPSELASAAGPAADWVLLATKAHQVEGAAAWLDVAVGPATRVAVLQNGVDHAERVAAWVPRERVVAVVVDCPSEATAPGHVVQRRPARLVVADDAAGRDFAALFAGSDVAVETTADLVTVAWRKLCVNAAGGALAALAGRPLPGIAPADRAALGRALAREALTVARAEGARLDDALADEIADALAAAREGGRPSTLADRLAGRPLEVEARNGAVVRLAARHGLRAPVNARAAALLATCHREPGDRLPALRAALGPSRVS